MGQACTMCDSESQGEFNVDVKEMPGCCDEHVSTKVGRRRKKDKKEKKEKKEKREKKDKGVRKGILQSQEAKTPRQTPDQTAKERVELPPLGLAGLGAPVEGGRGAAPGSASHAAAPEHHQDKGQQHEPSRQPAAPELAAEIPQHVARPWSKLPSVGTWLHPHPKATRSLRVAVLEVQADAAPVVGSAEALDEQAALAEVFAWAAADEALAVAAAEVPLCPATRKTVFVEGLAAPAATKETSKWEAIDLRSWEEVALAEIFAEAAAATKPPESLPMMVMEEAPIPAFLQQPVHKEPLTGVGGQSALEAAWAFKPSVGTWLRARAPAPAASAAADPVAEELPATVPVDVVPLDVPIPFSPPSVLSILATSGARCSPVPGGNAVISYGPQLPPPIFQDVPVATSLGNKSPPSSTTTTTTTATSGELTGVGPPALRAGRKTICL